jgi:SagB-type dehydrogenase family enzyme
MPLFEYTNSVLAQDAVLLLAREFVLIPMENGVYLDGGREPQILKGPLAVSLLPVLIPLINGTRTFAELLALITDVPREHTQELIESLIAWGVVTLGDTLASHPPEIRNTLSFLKRCDPEANLGYASEVLTTKRILIVFEPPSKSIAVALANGLQSNGFIHVEIINHRDLVSCLILDHAFLVSVVFENSYAALAGDFYGSILASNAPWLRTSLNAASGFCELGPIFSPESGLCHACLTPELPSQKQDAPTPNLIDLNIWSALLTSELTIQLLRTNSSSPRAYRRFHPPLFQHEVRAWPLAVTCPRDHHRDLTAGSCYIQSPSHSDRSHLLPVFFEESIACRQEFDDSPTLRSEVSLPSASTRLMLNSTRVALPGTEISLNQPMIDMLLSSQGKHRAALDLIAIATLLVLAVGYKSANGQESCRRWAPTGGNLGSVEAYLVVRHVKGLESGVYMYRPEEHALARINQRGVDHLQVTIAAVSANDPAPALLILAGAYKRVAQKYRSFAYKLLHLDAGVAGSQLLLIASSLGISVESISGWQPAAIEDALSLRSLQEVPTIVFRLASTERKMSASLAKTSRASNRVAVPSDDLSLGDLESLSSDSLVELMIGANQVVGERLPPRVIPMSGVRAERLQRWLSGATCREETLGSVLNKRSSARRFSGQALRKIDIRIILRAALENNVLRNSGLAITVLVQRSSDFEPGIYRYDDRTSALTRKSAAFSPQRTGELFFQSGYEDTPLIIWISGDIERAASGNCGGYQTLLVRAGFLGHRLWMASLGLGLSGVLLAGITSESPTKANRFIDERHTSLLAFLCGYPQSEDQHKGTFA